MYKRIELGVTSRPEKMVLEDLGQVNVISSNTYGDLRALIEAMMWAHCAFRAFAYYFHRTLCECTDSLFEMVTDYPIAMEWRDILLVDVWGKRTYLRAEMDGNYGNGRIKFLLAGENEWEVSYANWQASMQTQYVDARAWWIDFITGWFVPNNDRALALYESVTYPDKRPIVLMFGCPDEYKKEAEKLLRRFKTEGAQVFWFCGSDLEVRGLRGAKRYITESYRVVSVQKIRCPFLFGCSFPSLSFV